MSKMLKTWTQTASTLCGRTFPLAINTSFRGSIRAPISYDADRVKASQYNFFNMRGYTPFTYASNLRNEVASLANRAQKITPEPDSEIVDDFCKWVRHYLNELIPGFKKHWPVSNDKYLENSNATPTVKAAIRRAMDELQRDGIGFDTDLNRKQCFDWTRRKAFVKMENNLYCADGQVEWKPPRCIQGAHPKFIALVGPIMMTIQAELKRVLGPGFCTIFTSGVSSHVAAEHVNIPNWRIFENDVSSWDASICEELCKLECWIFERLGCGRACQKLMKANIRTHGVTTHGAKYSIRGTRKSGDPYTSCGNSLLNYLLHIYCLVRGPGSLLGKWKTYRKIAHVQQKIRMLVQGDDNLMAIHPELEPDFSLLLKLGFKSDNIWRKHIMLAEFCSCYVYRLKNGGVTFGPKLGRVMLKLCSFIEPPLYLDAMAVIKGVALGLMSAAIYVPGLKEVLNRLIVLTGKAAVVKPKDEEYKMLFTGGEPDHRENLFWHGLRYGNLTSFQKFWSTAKFGDVLDNRDHLFMFNRETAGPQKLVVSGLNGTWLV